MRIEPARYDDIRRIAQYMRERDFQEFKALLAIEDRNTLADFLATRYAGRDDVYVGWKGTDPVAVGAAVQVRPRVVNALFFANGMFGKIASPLTRFIRDDLFPALREAGAHRIEATTLAGYDASSRWLQSLGLAHEATHPGFGASGEAFETYAWVADAVRAASR